MISKTNKFVFAFLQIIAWLIFVGLSIEAGGIIVNFFFSLYNPAFVKNLYNKLDLAELYSRSRWAFFELYSLITMIAVLKALLFYMIILLLQKMNLAKPFDPYVARKISLLSYYSLFIGLLAYIGQETTQYLQEHGFAVPPLQQYWEGSQAFILMAAVIYVIAAIFTRGVELQNENDLTV